MSRLRRNACTSPFELYYDVYQIELCSVDKSCAVWTRPSLLMCHAYAAAHTCKQMRLRRTRYIFILVCIYLFWFVPGMHMAAGSPARACCYAHRIQYDGMALLLSFLLHYKVESLCRSFVQILYPCMNEESSPRTRVCAGC